GRIKWCPQQNQEIIFSQILQPCRRVRKNRSLVVIALNGNHRNARLLELEQNLLRLPEMRRLDLRPIEQVACDQENVSLFSDCFRSDKAKRVGEILIRQSSIETAAAEMDVGDVNDFHGRV